MESHDLHLEYGVFTFPESLGVPPVKIEPLTVRMETRHDGRFQRGRFLLKVPVHLADPFQAVRGSSAIVKFHGRKKPGGKQISAGCRVSYDSQSDVWELRIEAGFRCS